ncbi:MAG: glycosyltransferase, partial [Chloroflexi bacterium]|nr:glycosyltransferase [Chloroflexota bacterium]
MRIGQNPAKSIKHVVQPQQVTVAVVTYIPFLSGYYAQSLDVLKVCLNSIWEHTDLPYDLMVFDNGSCPEVRDYLCEARDRGRIQYLVLSEKNIGKGGAWNFIFGAAPGEYIAYADSDVYFYPGWLAPQLEVLETFPETGMVTGMPMWTPSEFSTATVRWAEANPEVQLERGKFLAWEDYWRHARSLGADETKARTHFDTCEDIVVIRDGKRYFVGAAHFQFVARKSALQSVLPIPSQRPMGQVRLLDIALNEAGYLR